MSAEAGERIPLWRLSGPQRLLEAGALLNSIAYFAAMPFAALYVDEHTGLSKPLVGAVVGGVALTSAFGGLIGGLIVDRFGALRLMRAGLAFYVLVYGLLATLRSPAAIVTLILLLGVARLTVEPGSKKLLSHIADEDGRVFRVRYMTLCLAAIVGPAIGGAIYHVSQVAFFAVPALFYALYLILFLVRNHTLVALDPPAGKEAESATAGVLTATLRDRRLLAVIIAGVVIFFVFSQLESMIPLYMRSRYGDRTEGLFAVLFIANAILALALQIPIDRLSGKLSRNAMVLLGAVMFAVSFLCFWSSSAGLAMLYLGIVFWTIGEGILLPMPDMAVHEMVDSRNRGAYFGLSEIRQLGFFIGPFAGGFLLGGGTTLYFTAMSLTIFLCVPLLLRRTSPRSKTDAFEGSREVPANG